jgi:hypothetical protein
MLQLIGEEGGHIVTAVFAGRQTDGVDHHQVNVSIRRARSMIGGCQVMRESVPTL